MQEVFGNTLGLKPSQLHALRRTYRRRVDADAVVSPELARHLSEVSLETRRQVGVLLDRKGDVHAVVVGDARKLARCLELGAQAGINYKEEDFATRASELTRGRGVDVVLDMVGGDYVARNLEALAVEGRLVQIAFLHGAKGEFSLLPVLQTARPAACRRCAPSN